MLGANAYTSMYCIFPRRVKFGHSVFVPLLSRLSNPACTFEMSRPITSFFKPQKAATASSVGEPSAVAPSSSQVGAGSKRKRDDQLDTLTAGAAVSSTAADEAAVIAHAERPVSAKGKATDIAAAVAAESVPAGSTNASTALAAFHVGIHASWAPVLAAEASKPYFGRLTTFVSAARAKQTIYPPLGKEYTALQLTPLDSVKVVILGQDPYHQPGQAHGLAFSVERGVAPPPSLRNMLKEAAEDVGTPFPPPHGNLSRWASQGVLLLNAVLTVERDKANAHQQQGWEQLTTALLSAVVKTRRNVVFCLWGKPAQETGKKAGAVDGVNGHKVLIAPHPSPLSAHRGFFGSKPYSQANAYLSSKGLTQIDWRLDGPLQAQSGAASASSSSASS